MSDIQRYALQTELSEDSLGKWVRYEDHLDEVAWAVSEVLDAARAAVATISVRKDTSWDMRVQALAAIDALRENND